MNYDIIIKSISTLMHNVWHVDKYKITFKLVINHWTNEISYHFLFPQANIIKLICADFH
jgi:hypothetical protein